MARMLTVTCGTHRHPRPIRAASIATIEDDLRRDGFIFVPQSIVVLTLRPKYWIRDAWGDGQWHGIVCANRGDVGKLLFRR